MTQLRLSSDSAASTEAVAVRLAQCCQATAIVIHLIGELGAGKTTFCRGFLHGLGYQGNVKSPTYTVVEPYRVGERDIYHFDLYRINAYDELEAIGIRDYFNGQSLCLVEWPERAEGELATPDLSVSIHYQGEARRLLLESSSSEGESILHCFEQDPLTK